MNKLIVDKKQLLQALYYQQSLVEKKIRGITGYTNLFIENTRVAIEGARPNLTLRTNLQAQSDWQGKIILPVHQLYEVIKQLSPNNTNLEINIDAEKNFLLIEETSYKFKINFLISQNVEEEKQNYFEEIRLPSNILYKTIENTLFATSPDENRLALNGLYFVPKEDGIHFVATDSYRICIYKLLGITNLKWKGGIISRKTLYEVKKMLNNEHQVILKVAEEYIEFTFNSSSLKAKLINAKFPHYQIPQITNNSFTLSKQDMVTSLQRVSILTNDKNHHIRISLENNQMILKSQTENIGEAEEHIKLIQNNTISQVLSLNSQYLLDILDKIPHTEVTIYLIGENRAQSILIHQDNLTYWLGLLKC